MSDLFTSVNPATGAVFGQYPASDPSKVEKAVKQAHKGFEEWSQFTLKERGAVLKQIAAELRKQKQKLAELATREMGKPIKQAMDEVEKCARTFDFYAKEGPKFLANELVETDAKKSYVSFQPLGVVLAIMPWNFPYWQVFRAMGPALMAGNTMVLKHASNVSACALAIEKVIKASGAPKGLFQTLLLPSSQVAGLIANPAISAITFTGSTYAGSKVAQTAAMHIKKQVLELGGSDAYIVLEDADMDLAVTTSVNGRLINSGQSCVAAKRFIAVKSVRKEFEARMVEQMKAAKFGDPMDEGNKIGPMARHDLRDQLHQQVLKSIEMGAKLLCGGYVPDGEGAFYPPTVLTNVKKGMPAYDEELFGPVASIIEAKDEQDAVRLANDSIYGLGAGIFSKNRKRAEHIAATQLQAGNCFVNSFVHSDPRLPFGGTKQSGYGRELSIFGIREFTNIKTVFIQ
ncbi:NAD-dependent succinate-semialdehyde dehydrogenase [Polluticoccus soli]|uniref:NAD-dependent succinate-semialdehyde dehydrogenase n=1 Tax=Polluticoccus soli TaxID=3034150 RepID=UPI0023E29638|nr:NAD-dependent succinate-semialdehyde dehydrogenase [Flavipsychrobacter sp. JY13-12]